MAGVVIGNLMPCLLGLFNLNSGQNFVDVDHLEGRIVVVLKGGTASGADGHDLLNSAFYEAVDILLHEVADDGGLTRSYKRRSAADLLLRRDNADSVPP